MFFLETALMTVYFNPDQYLPGFVAATVMLGMLMEPYYRQVARRAPAAPERNQR